MKLLQKLHEMNEQIEEECANSTLNLFSFLYLVDAYTCLIFVKSRRVNISPWDKNSLVM